MSDSPKEPSNITYENDSPGDGAVGKAAKDDLLAKIERGEKILVNNATVQLMRKKLPKLRLHYNTMSDLRRYHAALRREYLKLHPDAKDTIDDDKMDR